MARIRNIKPSFFLDSEVAALSPLARLFFIGLWCIADRDGRLKCKPMELAVQLIPYDIGKHKPEDLLSELEPRFVVRYAVDGQEYLLIRGFEKHQRPSNSEPGSELPEPPENILATNKNVASASQVGLATNKNVASMTRNLLATNKHQQEGNKGREGEGKGKGTESPSSFNDFWQSYPNKVGKGAALKAWEKAQPDLAACLKALAWQKLQPQWTKDGGRFIPHPATWLNQHRWEDEPVKVDGGNAARPVPGKYESDCIVEDGVVIKGGK